MQTYEQWLDEQAERQDEMARLARERGYVVTTGALKPVPLNEDGSLKEAGESKAPFDVTGNVFCPTGDGGGRDPTCSPGKGSGPGRTTAGARQAALAEVKGVVDKWHADNEVPLDRPLSSKQLAGLTKHLAQNLSEDAMSSLKASCVDGKCPTTGERYTLNVFENDHLSIYLLRWGQGEEAEWHDHGNGKDGARVGIFVMDGHPANDFFSGGKIINQKLSPGKAYALPAPYIHRVAGEDKAPAWTLHAYSGNEGGLARMNMYKFDEAKRLILDDAGQPVIESTWDNPRFFPAATTNTLRTNEEESGFWIEDANGELVLVAGEDLLSHKDFTEVKDSISQNVFCSTGEGGGRDPTCGAGGGGSGSLSIGTSVMMPSGETGEVSHIYEDSDNENGRLIQVRVGGKQVNVREMSLTGKIPQSDKKKKAESPEEKRERRYAPVGGGKVALRGVKDKSIHLLDTLPNSKKEEILQMSLVEGDDAAGYKLKKVPLSKIKPSQQGDERINDSSRESARAIKSGDLNDIAKADISPIVLESDYSIRDGNHRYSAAELNKQKYIYAYVKSSISQNVFCSTGRGGGVDPTCSPDTGGGFGGGGTSYVAARRDPDSKKWLLPDNSVAPEHIQKLGIPPAWKRVEVSLDPDAAMLARGLDKKGRVQMKYSATHNAEQSAIKFKRVTELRKKRGEIFSEIERDRKNPELKENAECLKVIMQTGIRPGGGGDTQADFESFGATTLQGRHVRVRGGKVSLVFVAGKSKGKESVFPVHDPDTAKMLIARKEVAGRSGNLFDTNSGSLRDYSKTKDGGGFKTKDHRTAIGTETAIGEIGRMKAPKNKKQYKEAVKKVAVRVAETLGNTATVALKSYIDPVVFAKWRQSSGT